MLGLLAALLTVTASYSLGYFADKVIFKTGKDGADTGNSVHVVVLGLGILSFIVLSLGLAGLIYAGVFWAVLALLNAVSLYLFIPELKRKNYKIEKLSVFEKILVCVIALTGAMLVVLSFRPVTNLDALSHMVLLPKSYIFKHAVYNLTSYSPSYSYTQLLTMLDMVVLSVSDEVAVNHLHLLIGFLTCAVMYAAAKKIDDRITALLTVLTIMTSSVFFDMSAIAKIDIGIALFSAAAFYCLVNWRIDRESKWFALAAVFCGFTFGTKYNGGLVPVFCAVFYFYSLWKNTRTVKENVKLALVSVAVFTACVIPWLALNYSFTNNPVSPFLAAFFNDNSMLAAMRELNKAYFRESSSNYFIYLKDVFLGMPVLFFMFFADMRKNTAVRLAFISGALYLLIGGIFFLHADRIFFPSFVLFGLVSAYTVRGLIDSNVRALKYPLLFIYFAMIAYGVYAIGHEIGRKENLSYFSGSVSKAEFLANNVSCYQISVSANRLVPAGEKVLGLGDPRGYYFNQSYVQEFSRVGFDIIQKIAPEAILNEMNANGIKYVLYSDEKYFNARQPGIFNSPDFMNKYFDLIAQEGDYSLFKVK